MKKKGRTMATGVLLLALTLTTFSGIPVNRVYAEEQVTEVATETDAVIDMADDDITYAGAGYDSLVVDAGETLALNATNFPDANFRAYLSGEFDTDGNGYIDPSVVTEIGCWDKQISSLKGIEYFPNLNSLLCISNNIAQLDVSNNTKLTTLSCQNNNLSQLDVSRNVNLRILYCQNNNIAQLDVSKNTSLQQLGCNNNNLTQLDVSENTSLERLDCSENNLTQLDVSRNTSLSTLYCNNNNLTQLDVSCNTKLTTLSCQYNNLTQLDVSRNTSLSTLYCNNNNLRQLDVSRNISLERLDCSENNLTQLEVSKNTNLIWLYCNNNNLTQLDVSNNTNLIHLSCENNNLAQLDMSKNINLTGASWSSPQNELFELIVCYTGERSVKCLDANGNRVINQFKCDGTYTYYFQADGTAMTDRLTYHPDGVHVIYFDEYGHEVFSDFSHVQKSIAGDAVDDYCFFDVNGYMYTDVLTYDKAGKSILYANPYGVLEHTGWFQFSDGGYGYANADATLMTDQYTYDWNGNLVYMEGDGHIRGTGDGRNLWPH